MSRRSACYPCGSHLCSETQILPCYPAFETAMDKNSGKVGNTVVGSLLPTPSLYFWLQENSSMLIASSTFCELLLSTPNQIHRYPFSLPNMVI